MDSIGILAIIIYLVFFLSPETIGEKLARIDNAYNEKIEGVCK